MHAEFLIAVACDVHKCKQTLYWSVGIWIKGEWENNSKKKKFVAYKNKMRKELSASILNKISSYIATHTHTNAHSQRDKQLLIFFLSLHTLKWRMTTWASRATVVHTYITVICTFAYTRVWYAHICTYVWICVYLCVCVSISLKWVVWKSWHLSSYSWLG